MLTVSIATQFCGGVNSQIAARLPLAFTAVRPVSRMRPAATSSDSRGRIARTDSPIASAHWSAVAGPARSTSRTFARSVGATAVTSCAAAADVPVRLWPGVTGYLRANRSSCFIRRFCCRADNKTQRCRLAECIRTHTGSIRHGSPLAASMHKPCDRISDTFRPLIQDALSIQGLSVRFSTSPFPRS